MITEERKSHWTRQRECQIALPWIVKRKNGYRRSMVLSVRENCAHLQNGEKNQVQKKRDKNQSSRTYVGIHQFPIFLNYIIII